MGCEPNVPITTFILISTTKPVTVQAVKLGSLPNICKLKDRVAELHKTVQDINKNNNDIGRKNTSILKLPSFTDGNFVLVAREECFAVNKLALRWPGSRRVLWAIKDYSYLVDDLRTGESGVLHTSRLKFYHDLTMDTEAVMFHVVQSDTGMIMQRLMRVEGHPDGR